MSLPEQIAGAATARVIAVQDDIVTIESVPGSDGKTPLVKNEVIYVCPRRTEDGAMVRLKAEVLRVRGDTADAQVFESTEGVGVGDPIEQTGEMLSVKLGPGLLGQVYDHLLPVHLVVEQTNPETETSGLALKAGTISGREIRNLETGRGVQIQGFRVRAVQIEQGTMVLETRPASGSHAERLRLRLTHLSADELRYQPGDLAPNFGGTIAATRLQLLTRAVETALPEADLAGSMIGLGPSQVPNPLRRYERLLERPVTGMRSIITALTWTIT